MNAGNEAAAVEAPRETPKSLVRKLAEIMCLVERIPKNGHNTFHGYDYSTEADIVAAVRTEMGKRHVMMVPNIGNIDWSELPTRNGTQKLCTMHVRFDLMDGESGELLSLPMIGQGSDSGDKAAYKALTGATKYALLKLFLIPTGDDPERDQAEPQERTRKPQRRSEAPRSENPAPQRSESPAQQQPAGNPSEQRKLDEELAQKLIARMDTMKSEWELRNWKTKHGREIVGLPTDLKEKVFEHGKSTAERLKAMWADRGAADKKTCEVCGQANPAHSPGCPNEAADEGDAPEPGAEG